MRRVLPYGLRLVLKSDIGYNCLLAGDWVIGAVPTSSAWPRVNTVAMHAFDPSATTHQIACD